MPTPAVRQPNDVLLARKEAIVEATRLMLRRAKAVYWSSEFSLALLVPEVLARTVVMMAHAAGSPPTSAEPHGGISPL